MQYPTSSKTLLAIGLAPFFAHAIDSVKDTSQTAVPQNGQYIVVLKAPVKNSVMTLQAFNDLQANFVSNQAQLIEQQLGTPVKQKFTRLLDGFVVKADKDQVQQLSKQPNVAYVEPDYQVTALPVSVSQVKHIQRNHVDWGLSRIDQHDLNIDGTYTYLYDGSGVTAYVVDTGINTVHQEFGGRAVSLLTDGTTNPIGDCMGHGTHVAGTIGGETSGVAKNVNLVGVRVLDCTGRGSYSQVIKGLELVSKLAQKSGTLSVVNMSLGGPLNKAVEQAVDELVKDNIPVVVAAGNKSMYSNSLDSCQRSPSHDKNAITVSATDKQDNRAYYSNFGHCTNIFAPGTDIISAWKGGKDVYWKSSGTSMASPHVAGVVALYLQQYPTLTPLLLKEELANLSTKRVIHMKATKSTRKLAKRSPNKLVYSLPY